MLRNVMEVPRPKFKLNPIPPVEEDPNTTFSQIPNEVMYLKDIRSYK